MNPKNIKIDPEGYLMLEELRVTEADFGRQVLANLNVREGLTYTKIQDEEVFVEYFDAPLMVTSITKGAGTLWTFQMPYEFSLPFDLRNLRVDDWDRFCGHFTNGVSFVLTRSAQASLFDMIDDFTDDSIVVSNVELKLLPRYKNSDKISGEKLWTDFYESNNTPWNLKEASPVLKQALNQLKLPRQRVLVLGAGHGHDAVELARQGHVVTAVDFSEKALIEFQKLYSSVKDVSYLLTDAFELSKTMGGAFDLIFDHAFFFAIEPRRRKEIVQVWKKTLQDKGHLLAIFRIADEVEGPPFGVSEWEVLQLLKKDFDFIYWTRTKASLPRRMNKELLVYAQKKL